MNGYDFILRRILTGWSHLAPDQAQRMARTKHLWLTEYNESLRHGR